MMTTIIVHNLKRSPTKWHAWRQWTMAVASRIPHATAASLPPIMLKPAALLEKLIQFTNVFNNIKLISFELGYSI